MSHRIKVGHGRDAEMVSEDLHNLIQRLLPFVGVLTPCLCIDVVVPIRCAFNTGLTRAWSECRGIFEWIAPTHELPVNNAQGKDIASHVVAGTVLGHALGSHKLPDATKLLAGECIRVVTDSSQAKVSETSLVAALLGCAVPPDIDKNVLWVEVTVVVATLVEMVETQRNVESQIQSVGQSGCLG